MKKLFASFVLSVGLVSSVQAQTLTFEGIGDGNLVGNYYNTGGAGPNYGISFSVGPVVGAIAALSSITPGCNGSAPFAGQPSGCGALLMPFDNVMMINRSAGFVSLLSFYYTSPLATASIAVFSDVNAGGVQLGQMTLGITPNGASNPNCGGTTFCPFSFGSLAFSGVARSVIISGPNTIAFDNITFTAAAVTPSVVPEPASYALMGFGLSVVGIAARRRRQG